MPSLVGSDDDVAPVPTSDDNVAATGANDDVAPTGANENVSFPSSGACPLVRDTTNSPHWCSAAQDSDSMPSLVGSSNESATDSDEEDYRQLEVQEEALRSQPASVSEGSVEKKWPFQELVEGGGKSDQSKRPNEPQAFYSRHSRADAELKFALDYLLKRFTPDMLEKASSKWSTTEHVCERYYAASLWTGSGLLQDTSAEKLATWLQLNKEDSVLVQDTCAALMHLQEPWLRGVAGANGEWEKQVFEMLKFEAFGPFVFGILLSHIRDKIKMEPSSALEGFTLLSETIRQWDADTDDKRLERQFLLKELCIGRRDQQLPTWSGAVLDSALLPSATEFKILQSRLMACLQNDKQVPKP